MCWTQRWSPAAHALCSIAYICAGAVQLVAGVFFLISLPVFKLGSNIWTGAWNIVIGIGAAMLACIGDLTPKKQESLLYFAISILAFNAVNLVVLEVGEWNLFLTEDVSKLISQNNLRKLIFYARITTSISSALAVITSFFDTQFTYCSMQRRQKPKNVHEQVSDIEYIIPRKKTSSVAKQAQNIYSQYAQSWVFDTDTTSSSKNESPYLKLPNNNVPYDSKTFGTRRHSTPKIDIICDEQSLDQKMFLVNPTVHVEPVSDDSNGGRSLNYMKSFSRTPSPAGVSESSSQDSSFNPPIYECLERLTEPTLYRSRLNTAISLNAEQGRQARDCGTLEHAKSSHSLRPRSDTFGKAAAVEVLHVPEKVQYASLMVELQQAIRSKKERLHQQQQQPVSPQSTCESVTVEDCSEPTQTESKGSNSLQGSSLDNSQRTEPKGSDTEFSKELEAALQLIQDLESPNTIETPSETCRSINGAELALPGGSAPVVRVKWRDSDASASGSTKTLSECVSPPELPADSSQGKATSVVVVASAGSGSQSSSGYSSPSHGNSKQPTPTCSKPPSVSGSSCNLVGGAEQQQVSYAICNTSGAAIISLYSPAGTSEAAAPEKKKKTPPPPPKIEVKEAPEPRKCSDGDTTAAAKAESPAMLSPVSKEHVGPRDKPPVRASSVPNGSSSIPEFKLDSSPSPASTLRASTSKWNVKSLLRKKTSPPMLTPELEGAIFKSESLAYLTELELLARHARNKSIQRQIEQRVQQQILGHSSSESHC